MRIGNQPQPIFVTQQQRTRTTEASGSMAKAVPRFQVGRVAAFVQHINNGTFGSADTRAFRSSAKPAAFAGIPAKATAPVVRAAPSTERMPALPPLKTPALVLALTGVVNRGGEGGLASAPGILHVPQAIQTGVTKPSVASLAATFESATLPPPSYAQKLREMRDERRAKLAFLPSKLAATTRRQRTGTRVSESARTHAPPERYEGMMRAERSEIHLHAVVAKSQPTLPSSPDAGTHDRAGNGDGDWDVMSALEPFKESLERMEVPMHPAIVKESEASVQSCVELDEHESNGMDVEGGVDEVNGSSIQSEGEDDSWMSDWGDDFDSDLDSGFEEDVDSVDHIIQPDTDGSVQKVRPETAEDRFFREGVECFTAAMTWGRPDAGAGSYPGTQPIAEKVGPHLEQENAANTDRPPTIGQVIAAWQLKLDAVRYQRELEAFDQLPFTTRMEGVESLEVAGGAADKDEARMAILGAIKLFDREALRKVGTVASEARSSDVERSFGGGFAKMLETHKESLLKHSHTASGLENDADADWDSYA